MTRTVRILNTSGGGDASPLIITRLDCPQHPVTIEDGREASFSIHDGCPAIVIGKQKLSDIDHPEFGEAVHLGDQGWASNIDGGGEQLMVWNGQTVEELNDLPRERLIEIITSMAMNDPNTTPTPAPVLDPVQNAGVAMNQGTGEQIVGETASKAPTPVNAAGDVKATDPAANAPGAVEAEQQRQANDAAQKLADAQTASTDPASVADLLPKTETTGLPASEGTPTGGTSNTVQPPAEPEREPWKPFEKRTKADLIWYLKAEGVDYDESDNKSVLLDRALEQDQQNLDSMKKAELIDEAKRRGVEVEDGDTKADIVAKLAA